MALEDIRWSAARRMGTADIDSFFLKPIRDSKIPALGEVPGTTAELTDGIALEYFDRVQRDRPPWSSVEPLVDRLASALSSDTPDDSLRAALVAIYEAEASRWYRQRATAPSPPGEIRRFLDEHERELAWLVQILTPLLVVLLGLIFRAA